MLRFSKFLDNARVNRFVQNFLAFGLKQKRTNHVIEIMQPYVKGRLLDVGCGTGVHTSGFICDDYVGIDINANFINYGRKKYRQKLMVMDATKLTFANSSFDSVVSISLLHHIPEEAVRKAFEEMKRVCRPGGYIAVLDATYPDNKFDFIGYFLCKIDRGRYMRTVEKTREILSINSECILEHKVKNTFPYTLYIFIYKNKDEL